MAEWWWYLLAVLAVYRVARMLAIEEGPFGIFAEIRGRVDPQQTTWLGRGLNCPLCIGFWVAFAMTLLLPFASLAQFVLTWWGLAGGAVVIYQVVDNR